MGKSKNKLPIAVGAKEFRSFLMPDIAADTEGNVITGHAAVFDQRTDLGLWTEVIERGAFDKCDFTDVLMSVNHDLNRIPLARSRNNNSNSTLQLQVDDVGLYVRALLDIENNVEAKALYSSIGRNDITGMSFIFVVRDQTWEGLDTEKPVRHITDISKVMEVSAVSFPAYDQTDISARSESELESLRQTLDSARAEYKNAQNTERRKKLIIKTYL